MKRQFGKAIENCGECDNLRTLPLEVVDTHNGPRYEHPLECKVTNDTVYSEIGIPSWCPMPKKGRTW